MKNWAGNLEYSASRLLRPRSVAQVQRHVAEADRIRPLGTRHSFSPVADTTGDLVTVADVPAVIEVDTARRAVRVSAGLRYGDLAEPLHAAGLALPNTASLPHISVAGACATATHGAGAGNPVLADAVRAMDIVTADGDLLTVDRQSDPAEFAGFPVSLGRLGVVVELVLDLVPEFDVAQTVVEDVPEDSVLDALEEVLAAAYSVSIFTDWRPDRTARLWIRERVGGEGGWTGEPRWGGRVADRDQHPVRGMAADSTTPQQGVPGRWIDRLPTFRLGYTPSTGAELQSEYVVPADRARSAWSAVASARDVVAPVLQVCEVRAIAPDPLWLSPAAGQPSVAFHFTWSPHLADVLPAVAAVESSLEPLGARPHWGKLFTMPGERVGQTYPRMPDFRRLVVELDPSAKFGNDLVDRCVGL